MSCNCNNRCNNNCNQLQSACAKCSHEIVETSADVNKFRDAFVTVREENAVYHVDCLGNTLAINRNPIYDDDYVPQTGDYKSVTVYNFTANEAYVFNNDGDYRIIALYSPGGESSS